jgi:hypothetical protein
MFRFMLLAAFLLDAALAAAAPAPRIPSRPGEREGPPGAPAAPAQPIAPGRGPDDPLDARDLARAMFEASRSNAKQNARQRLEAVRRLFHYEATRYRKDELEPTFDYLLGLSRRWRAAELALCEAPAERAAAYQRHWQDAWRTERIAKLKFDCGRIRLEELNASQYEELTAAMEWARAGVGKDKTRLLGETYPGLPALEVPFDDEMGTRAKWAKALFEGSQADLGELARQRVAAVRAVYRAQLRLYVNGKADLDEFLDFAVRVTEAELALPSGKVDAAAVRDRAWEIAWMAHEITRRRHQEGREMFARLLASRYALLQAEIALVRAGQARRLGRVSSLVNELDLTESFDAKALAQARAAVARANLDDLLRQRLEIAREGYHADWEFFLARKETLDVPMGWSRRLLDSELALADGPAGREAALARHWKRAWQAEGVIQRRYDSGRESIASLMWIRHARLEAERLWAPWQARK